MRVPAFLPPLHAVARAPRPPAMRRSHALLLSGLLCPLGAAPALDGVNLYDALYRAGYGKMQSIAHAAPLIQFMQKSKELTDEIHSVLDVGCSVGWAVKTLWAFGIESSGVDISAVAAAEADAKWPLRA